MSDVDAFLTVCSALTSHKPLWVIIEKAYIFLRDQSNWCQGAQALNARCEKVRINSPSAIAWSVEGALGKFSNNLGIVPPVLLSYMDRLVEDFTGCADGIGWFNDTYTHDAVLELLHAAVDKYKMGHGLL